MSDLFKHISSQPDQVKNVLNEVSPKSVEVIRSIKELIKEFISPASSLLIRGNNGEEYYDPEITSQIEISGLLLASLKSDFLHLQQPPKDEYLSKVLESYGIFIAAPETRKKFFQSWIALRTCLVIQQMGNYIEKRDDLKSIDAQRELIHLNPIGLPRLQNKLLNKFILIERKGF